MIRTFRLGLLALVLLGCSSSSNAGTLKSATSEDASSGSDGSSHHDVRDSGAHDTGPSDAAVDVAKGGDAGCSGPYLSAPILLPGLGGGIDIFGNAAGDGSEGWNPADPSAFHYAPSDEHAGATVTSTQVAALFCPSSGMLEAGAPFPGESTLSWDDDKVSIGIDPVTQRVEDLYLQTGYVGTLSFTSSDGATEYVLHLDGSPIHKIVGGTDTPVMIDWTDNTSLMAIGNGLYDALRVTFAPSVPASDCVTGSCVFGDNGTSGGYLQFPALHFAIFVATTSGSPTDNSAPVLLDFTNPAAVPAMGDGG